jgi:hypothetical protein
LTALILIMASLSWATVHKGLSFIERGAQIALAQGTLTQGDS